MKTVKVRTTMRPDEVLEVSEAEATDLRRQGLLKTDKAQGEPAKTEGK